MKNHRFRHHPGLSVLSRVAWNASQARRLSADEREKKKQAAIHLHCQGFTPGRIAKLIGGVSREWVREAVRVTGPKEERP